MFERYTERARRAIFFARYEAANWGSPYIEPEHLLLGILRVDKSLLPAEYERIRRKIETESPPQAEKSPTSVDIPLSQDAKRVLSYGAEEAEALGHWEINNGHLVLGLLRLENCLATALLKENGISLEDYRERVTETGERTPPARVSYDPSPVQSRAPVPAPVEKLNRLLFASVSQMDPWTEAEASQHLKRIFWTRKEALGHLVDCAAAHQQWLATALTESKLSARGFPEHEWIAAQKYDEVAWKELVDLWVALNRFLVHVITRIPEQKLSTPCRIGVADPIPLSALISRYVDYCEDLLGQILMHG